MRDDAAPEAAGGRVEAWIFLGIGAVVFGMCVLYVATAREEAGATMLLLTAGLGALAGGYLLFQARRTPDPAATGGHRQVPEETYLPHASVWPLGVGAGCVVMVNGLALGAWALVPGAMLTVASIWGYARQSRRRD
ncbi:MAG: cytochrome c oxidase subunit 4 [Acidimicrobiales bacterium]